MNMRIRIWHWKSEAGERLDLRREAEAFTLMALELTLSLELSRIRPRDLCLCNALRVFKFSMRQPSCLD
jgi:hypothetical protein